MKKLLFTLCAILLSVGAYAQKGQSAVGLNLNASPLMEKGVSLTNFGLSAKYQYGITDAVRAEATLGYDFKAKGASLFEAGVNAHYLFKISEKAKIYPIVGLGYANIKAGGWYDYDDNSRSSRHDDDDDYSATTSKFYFNAGAGAEYALTSHLSANIEIKYQYIKMFSRLPISLGVTYKF